MLLALLFAINIYCNMINHCFLRNQMKQKMETGQEEINVLEKYYQPTDLKVLRREF